MKRKALPFDHRPDPVLGTALRQALSADDHSAFVARVLGAHALPHALHWDVLTAWARRGAAAACVAALGALLLVGGMQPAPVDLVASVAGPAARELVASFVPPHLSDFLLSGDER